MPWIAVSALLLACFLWAVSFIATKVALDSAPPLTVVTLRLAISALCFLPWLARRARGLLRGAGLRCLLGLFVLSLYGTGLHYGIQTIGLQYTSSSNASLYVLTAPITIILLGALFLRERITPRKVFGIALALAGVLAVMGMEELKKFEWQEHLLGDLLVLLSIVMWGLFTVFGKKTTDRLGALNVTALVTLIGALWMIPVGWTELHLRSFSLARISAGGWLAIVFLGVCCSFLATLLYFMALARSESQKVGIFLYTIPPMTAVIAVVYRGETLGVNFLVGFLLVAGGVYLTERG